MSSQVIIFCMNGKKKLFCIPSLEIFMSKGKFSIFMSSINFLNKKSFFNATNFCLVLKEIKLKYEEMSIQETDECYNVPKKKNIFYLIKIKFVFRKINFYPTTEKSLLRPKSKSHQSLPKLFASQFPTT